MIFDEFDDAIFDKNFIIPGNSPVNKEVAFFDNNHNSLFIKSLKKLKANCTCDIKRKIIDKHIDDYNNISFGMFSDPVTNPSYFIDYDKNIDYARLSYQNVIKEQQSLEEILRNLNFE